jgi:hypothetical protein
MPAAMHLHTPYLNAVVKGVLRRADGEAGNVVPH